MNDDDVKKLVRHMVDRFLGWKLPEDFLPDAGISFTRHRSCEPIGTNLFTATQAEAMVRYMLEGTSLRAPRIAPKGGFVGKCPRCTRVPEIHIPEGEVIGSCAQCWLCEGVHVPFIEAAPAEATWAGHDRPDGKPCAYLAKKTCNKCGWIEGTP